MINTLHPRSLRWKTVLALSLAAFVCLKGQEPSEVDFRSDPAYILPGLAEKSDHNTLRIPEIKKVSFSLTSGMMLGKAGQNNYFASAYMAPAVAYNILPRLRVRAGCLIFLNSMYNSSESSLQSGLSSAGPWQQMALFVAADYFVTDRIILTGTYYKNTGNEAFQSGLAPEVYNRYQSYRTTPSESMSLGLHYNITKGFSIGAEVRISNQYQPSLSPYPYGTAYPQSSPFYY